MCSDVDKRISAVAIQSLKEALVHIFWYKKDLKSFLGNCITDKKVISQVDWDGYKRQIGSDIVDALCADQDKHLGDLRRLCQEITKMTSFRHLEQLEDGKSKAKKARDAVADLRKLVETHEAVTQDEAAATARRESAILRLKQNAALQAKLAQLKEDFMVLATSAKPTKRGYLLETLMLDVFTLFDLDPKASFRNIGEQIDGAFSLQGTEYLFEAKWQDKPCDIQDLDAFGGKVRRKLENTLGLFLSINGFSKDGVVAHSIERPVMLLMTGSDLMAVLDQRIDFVTLLQRKKRHASRTGKILLLAEQILT